MNRLSNHADSTIHGIVLLKGCERWVLMFDAKNKSEAVRQLGRWACNEDLNFTWYDAAVMSQKIRKAEING